MSETENRRQPSGWTETTLGEILLEVVGGGTPSKKNLKFYDGNIPWLTVKDMRSRRPQNAMDHISKEAVKNSATNILPPDTLIIATRVGLGKVIRVPFEAAINQDLKGLIPSALIDKDFLEYWFVHKALYLGSIGSGTTVKGITLRLLNSLNFSLPPQNEQKRIVEKIEELFSELDAGIEALKTAKSQLKTYRQAVLKAAFEGKLTEDWRQENADQVIAPEKLTKQIQGYRKTNYLENYEKAVTEGKRKPRKVKVFAPIAGQETEYFPEENGLARLGDVVVDLQYGTSKKCTYKVTEYPVLRIPNIADDFIDRKDLKYASFSEEEIENYAVETGDVLIIRSNGSLSLVGKPALATENERGFLYAGYLIRLRVLTQAILPKTLYYLLKSPMMRQQIEKKGKSTSGVNNINTDEINSLIVPIFSLGEQEQIINEIETRLSVSNQLERDLEKNLNIADATRQSILKRTFEGKLVPQDPNDEPAKELLKKIKAERDKLEADQKSAHRIPKNLAKSRRAKGRNSDL